LPTSWNPTRSIGDLSKLHFERVKTNGIYLNVISTGPTNGPLLVLLHGFPETALLSWSSQFEAFAQAGYHVIAPDQRGYNTSDKPEGISSYVTDELVADIIGLFDHYKAQEAFVVGHDWGSVVAWQLGIRHSDRVKKIAVLNVPHPLVFLKYVRSHVSQALKSWYIFFFQLPYVPEFVFTRENCRVGRSMLATSSVEGHTFSPDLIPRYLQGWTEKNAMSSMINWYRAAVQIESLKTPDPERIVVRSPTLVIWGKKDTALEAEMADLSVKLCENGRAVYFEDATHWVQHDKPVEVATHIIDFFRE